MYFASAYRTPMDQGYQPAAIPPVSDEPVLEEPIVPLRQLGSTVPEKLPTGANILQNTEAAIRAGQPNIQFVFTTQANQAIGGRPKAYGTEVREALRSMAKVNEVFIEGVEVPSGSVNLTGFDQQNGFTEEKRQHDLDEIRDYIKFAADVGGGGGVDIWAAEFPRTIFDAAWNRTDPQSNTPMFEMYKGEADQATKVLVDKSSGRVIRQIRMNERIPFPVWNVADKDYYDPDGTLLSRKGEFIDYEKKTVPLDKRVPRFNPQENRFDVKEYSWKDFEEEARLINKEKEIELRRPLRHDELVSPEEAFFQATTRGQEAIARGFELSYTGEVGKQLEALEKLKKAQAFFVKAESEAKTDEEKMIFMRQVASISEDLTGGIIPRDTKLTSQIISEAVDKTRRNIEQTRQMAIGQRIQQEEQRKIRENVSVLDSYAKQKLFDSYAQMGIFSMQETVMNKNAERPIYVGPEIGWPTYWGGHPEEFKEIIKESRKKMINLLTKPTLEGKPNPFYTGMDEKTASNKARDHIKGVFDTSHMGMWLNNFRRAPGESEEKRLEEFKKWYLGEVEKIAKDDHLIGAIQAVDSASGAHGHLPPGQGILPVVDAVKIFKKFGFDGAVISEGHEEEQFGQQRIFMEAMKAFGTTITNPYGVQGGIGSPMPYRWGAIRNSYFGRTYTPMFIVGAYSPSNEFKLWSEVPLE